MNGRPSWDAIRVFLAVARAGSLIGAARALRVSEATVSRQLRTLETELGARLFDRLPNRLALTGLGRGLLDSAEAMAAGADDLARRALAASAASEHPVRITATSSMALFLVLHLQGLTDAAAGALLTVTGTRAMASLARREADLALRMRRPPDSGHLRVRRVGQVAFTAYAAHGTGETRLIGLREDPSSSQSAWLETIMAGRPVPVRLDDVHLRREACRAGKGVTLLPCFLGDADPSLRRICPPSEELIEDVYILVHEEIADLPPIARVRRALVDLFREQHDALLGVGDVEHAP